MRVDLSVNSDLTDRGIIVHLLFIPYLLSLVCEGDD